MTSVTFLTRRGCPLCDEALAVVAPLAAQRGVALDVLDVDLDRDLLQRYTDRVPVLLDPVAGTVLAEGHIGRRRASRALRRVGGQ